MALVHTKLGKIIGMLYFFWWYYHIYTGSDHRGLVFDITEWANKPNLLALVQSFLSYFTTQGVIWMPPTLPQVPECPFQSTRHLQFKSSVLCTFFAPSNPCGVHSLCQEHIWLTWNWRGVGSQQDMVLVNTGNGGNKALPMSGHALAHILLLFSLYGGITSWAKMGVGMSTRWAYRYVASQHKYWDSTVPHLTVVHVNTIYSLHSAPSPILWVKQGSTRSLSQWVAWYLPIISFMSTDSLTTIHLSYYNASSGVCCQLNLKLHLLQQPGIGTHLLFCKCTFILVYILYFSIIYFWEGSICFWQALWQVKGMSFFLFTFLRFYKRAPKSTKK